MLLCVVLYSTRSMVTFGDAQRGTWGWATQKWHSQGDRSGDSWGGCGKAYHEGKVLGTAGANAQTRPQEGSRKTEDAVL